MNFRPVTFIVSKAMEMDDVLNEEVGTLQTLRSINTSTNSNFKFYNIVVLVLNEG